MFRFVSANNFEFTIIFGVNKQLNFQNQKLLSDSQARNVYNCIIRICILFPQKFNILRTATFKMILIICGAARNLSKLIIVVMCAYKLVSTTNIWDIFIVYWGWGRSLITKTGGYRRRFISCWIRQGFKPASDSLPIM